MMMMQPFAGVQHGQIVDEPAQPGRWPRRARDAGEIDQIIGLAGRRQLLLLLNCVVHDGQFLSGQN